MSSCVETFNMNILIFGVNDNYYIFFKQASQSKETVPPENNKDGNLVSYSAVLAKRQRMLSEPKGVPPPQGVLPPSPIRHGMFVM